MNTASASGNYMTAAWTAVPQFLLSPSKQWHMLSDCLTCCCPCIAFGRIAEIVEKGRWYGNLEGQNREVTMASLMENGMKR
ncbi:uncharacterized protein LOC116130030 [Pistacia vera]|uniref:uncharacterized protein LOC116130030 n=1 Tax=Pistacia vera TaxID=55513 RepID=UPI001262CEFB|nr:uncharacterized protein LOC116130030 [Pistacia vera]